MLKLSKVWPCAGLLLAVAQSAWAEQTVCYAFERTFLAECGACPAGAELVSGPNKPLAGCKAAPLRDPRLISQEEGMALLPGAARKRIGGWQSSDVPSPPAAEPAAAPAPPAAVPKRTAPRLSFRLLSN
ncbi:hypothetical protein [Chitinimonas sp.]|uniref:hypothetical protein n=1 Tax=Chitinimonas sp. TaxID=1934313 RepID=UPI002F931472